ncbi:hypothetical protein BDP27DRAFT_1362476 [Rhodocollybia butyracea]|uniref:Uncharacterized protein n=1 Tax=Rhodocollybia butyracea TaxID=206335 RepID=A0A9P5PR12_9AGAR|nr:hypothetical protein BDP27DRAFT_1362476 [Rhodocollybia butyracea]
MPLNLTLTSFPAYSNSPANQNARPARSCRRNEVSYMWKKPLRITFVRCLFALTRYLPVAIHMIDVVFVEIALMLRVYHTMQRVFRSDAIEVDFSDGCISAFTQFNHALSMVFISGEMTIQLLILALVLKRTIWDFRQYSHSLFSVLNRDGLIVFGAMGVAMITIGVGSAKKGAAAVFIFPLFISLISAVGCHTILNLQKLGSVGADANPSEQKKELELNAMNITTWDERTFQTVDCLPNALEHEIVTMHSVPPVTV